MTASKKADPERQGWRCLLRRRPGFRESDYQQHPAQFEREVTGERIRDKIAASKKKGMWMGGQPSLGYDVKDRKLVVNETEAATVRHIFQRYLELGTVRALRDDLAAGGVRMAEKSSLRDEAKMHPPQALEKRPGFPAPTIPRQFSPLARRLMVCTVYSAGMTGLERRMGK